MKTSPKSGRDGRTARRDRTQARGRATAPLYERLEDRVLFDAAVEAAPEADDADEAHRDADAARRFEAARFAEDVRTVSDIDRREETVADVDVRRELVIVDRSVEDYEALVADLTGTDEPGREIEVVTISGDEDGIASVSEVLRGRSGLDAVHIVSHGDERGLNLGGVWLSRENLTGYAGEIAAWGSAFAEGGDLLLLGCDLAGSSDGRELLRSIGVLTGADVAASDDPTGSAARGGDWDLEHRIGSLETTVAFSEAARDSYRHLLAPGPQVTLGLPSQPYVGGEFTFTATFENTGPAGDTGFGPFVDLLFPADGADGADGTDTADGLQFVGASYLGSAVNSRLLTFPDDGGGTGSVDHPYAVDSAGNPVQVTGAAGDQLVVLQLPFGSFAAGQPAVTLDVRAAVSNLADPYDAARPETELAVTARAGFRYGADAADNPATDPTILSDTQTDSSAWAQTFGVQPQLLRMVKTYIGPEGETATGPNYIRSYRIDAFVADGQTIEDLTFTDFLPDSLEYAGNLVVTGAANFTVVQTPSTPGAQSAPDNDLVVRLDDPVVGLGAGTAAASVRFDFFVPIDDAAGAPTIDPASGDDTSAENDASLSGTWDAIDPRDGTAPVASDVTTVDHRLEQRAIAVQKGVANVQDNGTPGNTPGDLLQYGIDFQVSDFFAFEDVVVTDVFSDGQDWHTDDTNTTEVFIPTLEFRQHGAVVATAAFDAANYSVTENADGTTTVAFRISDELVTRGGDGRTLGGWVPAGGTGSGQPDGSFDGGATTGRIVFRTLIREEYKVPGGNDPSVDQGDGLSNDVTVDAALLDVSDLSPRGTREADDSAASLRIATGSLGKSIYAVNGNRTWQAEYDPDGNGNPNVVSGDLITYRIEYQLPTSDVEDFQLVDFLPLPVFDATGLAETRGLRSDTAPGENRWHLHTDDTFTEYFEANASEHFGATPDVSLVVDSSSNSFALQYGTVDDPASGGRKIDILVTVPIESAPAADGLFYTNQSQTIEGNTFGGQTVNQVISQQDVEVLQPDLRVTKGVVSTSEGGATFSGPVGPAGVTFESPGSSNPSFTGTITSAGLAITPIDANVDDLDAGDLVKFAIVIENTGSADAFDLTLSDLKAAGFDIPTNATGLNLEIRDGDGNLLTYSGNAEDLFTTGVSVHDPIAVFLASDQTDELIRMDSRDDFDPATNSRVVGDFEDSGSNAYADIEALARDPFSGTLYGSNANRLVEIDTATGEVTPLSLHGTATFGGNNLALTDIDALTFNFQTGELWGAQRADLGGGAKNYIVKLDPATGAFIPGAFGGQDALEVDMNVRMDDMAFDRSGDLYATDASRLFRVDIDPTTFDTTLVQIGTGFGGTITDMEGLSVDEQGRMWGTTGNTGDAADINSLWEIDKETGLAFNQRQIGNGEDFEGSETYFPDAPGAINDADEAATAGDGSNILIVTYDLVVSDSVAASSTQTNTAGVDAYANRDGGEDFSAIEDDTSDTATVGITAIVAQKSIVTTSEAHTPGSDVAIGEVVRYRLQVELPQGTAANLQLRDYLPGGLTFLDDGTAMAAFVSDGDAITSSTLSGGGLSQAGNETNVDSVTPTFVLPDAAVSRSDSADNDTYGSGTDVYFKFGDVVNADGDGNSEFVVVEFNAVVDNDFGGTTNDANETRNNTFRVRVDGADRATSNGVAVRIHEPRITNLTTTVAPVGGAPGDADDLVEFTVTFSSQTGGQYESAFDALLTSAVPADYSVDFSTISITPTGGTTGVTDNSSGNNLDIAIDEIPVGGGLTVTFRGTLVAGAEAGKTISTTANLTYTSLPGGGTAGNPTGSDTPGASGDGLGERNGSDGTSAPNDHFDTDTADFTVAAPELTKRLVGTEIVSAVNGAGEAVIGELVTYELVLTIPEGQTRGLTVTDTLDAGLAYVDLDPSNPPVFNNVSITGSTTPTVTNSGGTATFNLGTATNAESSNATDETITITYRAVVLNTLANQDGQQRGNSAVLTWDEGTLAAATAADVTIVEPGLTLIHSVALDTDGDSVFDDGTNGDAGDAVRYTVTLANASGDAFDIDFADPLPTLSGGSSAVLNPTFTVSDTATSGAVSAADFELVGSNAAGWTLRLRAGRDVDMLASQVDGSGDPRVITFEITGTIATGVAPNQPVAGTATVEWTSLDGDFSATRSTHNAAGVERSGGGGVDDYRRAQSATFTVNPPEFRKELFSTDRTETSGSNVTVGETVTYALVVSLPEGSTPDITVTDLLPDGLRYTGYQIVTAQAASGGLLLNDYNGTLPTPSVSNGGSSGDDVDFTFGQTDTTVNNDGTDNAFLILVRAVVVDEAAVNGYVGNQDVLTNSATIDFATDSQPPQASNSVDVTVVEPSLRITHEFGPVVDADVADAGDTLTVTLTVDNTAGTSTAYDVQIRDILSAANFDLSSVSLGASGTNYPADFSPAYDAGTGTLTYTGGDIAAGASVTFTFTVDLADGVAPGATLTDAAEIVASTTLDGTVAGERNDTDPDSNNNDSDDDTVRIRRNSLAGFVWDDTDNDGVFDAAETGITGVEVRLVGTDHLGNSVDTTVSTVAGGGYLFDNLRPGTYTIIEDPDGDSLPAGYLDGTDTIGTPGGDDSADDRFGNISLPTGNETHGTNNNFGEIRASRLAGAVYHDADNDGTFDGTESGINGVSVRLTGTDDRGNTVNVLVNTAGGGLFEFTNLRPSDASGYTITQVAQPAGFLDGIDSDGSLANGSVGNDVISSVNVATGQNGTGYRFGEVVASSLSGYVYHDANNNGDRSDDGAATVSGIQGAVVRLTGTDDRGTTVNRTATTNSSGFYEFTGLRPSDATGYTLSQDSVPAGFIDGRDTIGTPGGDDSVNDAFSDIVVVSATTGQNNNFGELRPASLSGRVFNDHDNDGTFDPGDGEAGIGMVSIRLTGTDDLGNAVDVTVQTTAAGVYTFTNLRPSNAAGYTITESQPAAYNDGIDSDGSLANGVVGADAVSSINVSSGDAGTGYNFAERGASISGTVFRDDDRDGTLDAGENARLDGVRIELYDSTGTTLIAFTQTLADGTYSFDHLPAGDYQIRQIQPPEYGTTSSNTLNVTLPLAGLAGQNFGEALYDIGDRVWFDADGDGIDDAGEPGLGGVGVTLRQAGDDGLLDTADDVIRMTTTAADGSYEFTEVFRGDNRVTLDPATLPAGVSVTYERHDYGTPTNDGSANITVDAADDPAVDFGLTGTGTIGDYVWLDVNGDAVQDAGEPGLRDVTVDLLFAGRDGVFGNADDFTLTTTTDASGGYSFERLPSGVFRMTVDTADADLPGGLTTVTGTESVGVTTDVTLAAGETNNAVDFSFTGTRSLGDRVWFDADGDGVQDAGEPGFEGVDVALLYAGQDGLFGTGDDVTRSTTTGANGAYGFDFLPEGDFRVTVTRGDLPAGTVPTFDRDDAAPALDDTANVTVGAGDRTDVDFGYRGTSSIGDRVVFDEETVGVQDAGDFGLPGVVVRIAVDLNGDSTPDYVATDTTDIDGFYGFANLVAGTYTVTVDPTSLPAGTSATFDADGNATPLTSTVVLAGGTTRNDQDFGVRGDATVGDRVWLDRDGDGIQDAAGEPGVANVGVRLTWAGVDGVLGTADDETFTTTTDADGDYLFTGRPAGPYRIALDPATLPAGTSVTTGNDPQTFPVAAGSTDRTRDFGLQGTGSIGDTVTFDADNSGDLSAGDSPYPGVTVTLTGDFDGDGNAEAFTTVTDAAGRYDFGGLPLGDWTVSLTPPAGTAATFDADGTATPNTSDVTLTAGTPTRDDQDFGLTGTGSVENLATDPVFYDRDRDGVFDADEVGIPGVTVRLDIDLDGDGTPDTSMTTVTNPDGTYTFENVPAGDHRVVVLPPAGLDPTTDLDGDTTPDTDADVSVAPAGTTNPGRFGFVGDGRIGDRVWFDADGDGTQDDGSGADPAEPGIPGLTVTLEIDLNGDGTVDQTLTTVTGPDGSYEFTDLPAGDYAVSVARRAGTLPTFDADGTATPDRSELTLAVDEVNDAIDFGYRGTASIGDRILFDADRSGDETADDRGLPGVTVTASVDLNGDGTADYVVSDETDIDGYYGFTNLLDGTYVVTVDTDSLPAGLAADPTFDADGTGTPHESTVTLAAGESNQAQDFGYYADSTIGDRVWLDRDGDGVQDAANEPGVANVDVLLTWAGRDGVFGTADDEDFRRTTDADGLYAFNGRPAGEYRIALDAATLPAGTSVTTGNDPQTFTLPVGASDLTRDFGLVGVGSVGDTVTFDADNSGDVSAGDSGYPGVTVRVRGDFDGDGVIEELTTTTDSDGRYDFDGLPLGDWTVSLTPPAGTSPTFDADGTATPNSSDVTLTAGTATRDDQDFGLTGTGSVANLVTDPVFYDQDGDGVFDANESGIPGVTVRLDIDLDGDGIPDTSMTTQTDQDGNYTFGNVPAGDHTLTILPPAGLSPTTDLDGNGTPDTDADATVAPAGTTNPAAFGLIGDGEIGDTVFYDADSSGTQDAGEPGIPGVQITLEIDFNGDGTVDHTRSTTTNSDGSYSFTDLPAGDYRVVVTRPAGTEPTADADGLATPDATSLTLPPDGSRDDIDFAYRGTGAVADVVFHDVDGDGLYEPTDGDRPLTEVLVTLSSDLDGDGTPDYVTTTRTDAGGGFRFDDLLPGAVTITTEPADMIPGLADNPIVDNDGIGTPHAAVYEIPVGGTATGTGFGFHATPDYEVIKTTDAASLSVTDGVRYQITVRNNGDLSGRNVVVTDRYPTDLLRITEASGGVVDADAGTITWTLAALEPGEAMIFLVDAEVPPTVPAAAESVLNSVDVTDDGYNGRDPNPDDNTSSVTTPLDNAPDYRITVDDGLEEARRNQEVTHTVVVTNDGPQDGSGVVVTGQLPPGLLLDVTPGQGGTYDPETGLVSWPVGPLASGETVILTVTGRVPNDIPTGADTITHRVEVTDDGLSGEDLTPENNTDLDTTKLPTFAFDSIRDPSGGGLDLDPFNNTIHAQTHDVENETYALPIAGSEREPYRAPPLPIDTVYTGIVDPGTTVSGKVYDNHGRLVGEQTVVADTAGNWLMQFPTLVLHEHPHEMRLEQTAAIQNVGADAGFNLRRFFHPAVHTQIFMTESISVEAAFRHTPWNIVADMHAANMNPLAVGWNHHSYELLVASTNVSGR